MKYDFVAPLMNECEHSTQITHINLYFEKMAVNLLLEHLPMHEPRTFLHWFLDFGSPLYQAAADCLTFRLSHVIRNSFSSFCKIGINTNKSNSSWNLLSGLKILLIVMSVKNRSTKKVYTFSILTRTPLFSGFLSS